MSKSKKLSELLELDENLLFSKEFQETLDELSRTVHHDSAEHKKHANYNGGYNRGDNIFHIIAKNYNEYFEPAEILQVLCNALSGSGLLESKDGDGFTPLLKVGDHENTFIVWNCYNSACLECIYTLLKAGANLHAEHSSDEASFITSIKDIVFSSENFENKLEVEQEPTIDLVFADIFQTLIENPKSRDIEILIAAFGKDKNKIAEALLNGANIEAKTKNGYTPLMLASMFGTPETVKFLIDKGANINVKDENGNNLITLAVIVPQDNCGNIRVLSQAGVDLNSQNNDGFTPIAQAVNIRPKLHSLAQFLEDDDYYSECLKKIEFLVELGCSIENVNGKGDNALTFAANNGRYRAVKNLLLAGVNPEIL